LNSDDHKLKKQNRDEYFVQRSNRI